MARQTTKTTVAKARHLRRAMSLPEVLLWRELRSRPLGVKFRRQHPIGDYVLDFYCAEAKLGVEVDGVAHDMGDRPERNEARTAMLLERGVTILRIPARELLQSPAAVAETIVRACRQC